MTTSNKQFAKANGHKYYEGPPCPRGHTSRYVIGDACVLCAKQRSRFRHHGGELRHEVFHALLMRKAREVRKTGQRFEVDAGCFRSPPETCPVLGIPLRYLDRMYPLDDHASFVMADPAQGWVKGNVLVVSYKAAHIREHVTQSDFDAVNAFFA